MIEVSARRCAVVAVWATLTAGCAALGVVRDEDGGVGADAGQAGGGHGDAGTPQDAGGSHDAGGTCTGADASWTCTADGADRERCLGGTFETAPCVRGCLRPPPGTEASCLSITSAHTCTGGWGTNKSTSGDYDLTAFGCWVDASGSVHTDPGDNCIPTCLAQARSSGLCQPTDTGPQCEERVTWFTADAARFGCLARLRITNPATGKAVIAVALDYGPSCTVENSISFAVLDASGRVDRQLFGSDQGAVDRALVHVVEVDPTTPLGPVP